MPVGWSSPAALAETPHSSQTAPSATTITQYYKGKIDNIYRKVMFSVQLLFMQIVQSSVNL